MSKEGREDIPPHDVPKEQWLSDNEPRHMCREAIARRRNLDREGIVKRIGKRIEKFEQLARRLWAKSNM